MLNDITRITLTGADERTSIMELVELVGQFAEVEVGILYTTTPEGRNRYPSRAWILDAAEALGDRCAIHVCGSKAREELLSGRLLDITRNVDRVQVNGRLDSVALMIAGREVKTLITQHTPANAELLACQVPNHQVLIDGSGGRGVSPDEWKVLSTWKPYGRAGGLGPMNLAAEVRSFGAVAKPGAWVDMETKLRDAEDWFSVDIARQCAQIFYDTINAKVLP